MDAIRIAVPGAAVKPANGNGNGTPALAPSSEAAAVTGD
jgi:hypothetical protein